MQTLECQYVGQFNARPKCIGTLWEGRYKSCLVDSETYVLSCYRYIELNPVRARMCIMALHETQQRVVSGRAGIIFFDKNRGRISAPLLTSAAKW